MKRSIVFGAMALLAGSLFAADSGPKDEVTAAAKKLAEKDNYSWKITMDLGPNSQFTPGPSTGKTEKDGYTWLSVSFNDNTSIGVAKEKKVAVKTDEGWQSGQEASGDGGGGGGFNAATFMARRMQNLKVPAAEVQDLVTKVQELKKDGDVYSGDLTEEGAKALLTMGFRRPGGQGPSNAKGSAKFWIKDGGLTKYETKVTGKRQNQNGDDVEIERTTTIEIKDVGTTKLDVPDEAKKKLS
jgi:hypothetical protein